MPAKPAIAILCFAAIMASIRMVPAFEQFHVLGLETFASVVDFRGRVDSGVEAAGGQLIDRGKALESFYRQLEKAERREPGAAVNVLHYGDSPISADQISADVRTLLQQKFGNGGEGFLLIAKPWAWYNHRGVEMSAQGWTIQTASQVFAPDGLHGIGGASFEGGPGAQARFQLSDSQQCVEVFYEAQPGGGSVEVLAGSSLLGEFTTAGPSRSASHAFSLPDTARDIKLLVKFGKVRLYGVSFQKDGPGIRYNSLGLNAAQIGTLLNHFEPRRWAEQLRHQRPDLVVINYGANEAGYPAYIDGTYESDLRKLILELQNAVPDASLLIMSPMDRGTRDGSGRVVTLPKLPTLVGIQRRVAAETGCAFFNTFEAMGGEGAMASWYEMRPRLASSDFMHPLPAGAKRIGTLFERALYQGYLNWKTAKANARPNNQRTEKVLEGRKAAR